MKKSELTEVLSKEMNIPEATGHSIINTILDAMTETIVKGDNVEIRGFGSFTVKHYDPYTGRNPKKNGTQSYCKEAFCLQGR
jgi:integration host factor subunit beta